MDILAILIQVRFFGIMTYNMALEDTTAEEVSIYCVGSIVWMGLCGLIGVSLMWSIGIQFLGVLITAGDLCGLP